MEFDLVRITKARKTVGISANTIRAYAREGKLKLYRNRKCVFFSRAELTKLIMDSPMQVMGGRLIAVA